jgi:hypothetical protein
MCKKSSIQTGTAAPQPGMLACEITFPFSYCYASVAVLYIVMAAVVARKAQAFASDFLIQKSSFRHRNATSRGHDTAHLALDALILAVVAFASRGIWSFVLASVVDPSALHCATFFRSSFGLFQFLCLCNHVVCEHMLSLVPRSSSFSTSLCPSPFRFLDDDVSMCSSDHTCCVSLISKSHNVSVCEHVMLKITGLTTLVSLLPLASFFGIVSALHHTWEILWVACMPTPEAFSSTIFSSDPMPLLTTVSFAVMDLWWTLSRAISLIGVLVVSVAALATSAPLTFLQFSGCMLVLMEFITIGISSWSNRYRMTAPVDSDFACFASTRTSSPCAGLSFYVIAVNLISAVFCLQACVWLGQAFGSCFFILFFRDPFEWLTISFDSRSMFVIESPFPPLRRESRESHLLWIHWGLLRSMALDEFRQLFGLFAYTGSFLVNVTVYFNLAVWLLDAVTLVAMMVLLGPSFDLFFDGLFQSAILHPDYDWSLIFLFFSFSSFYSIC